MYWRWVHNLKFKKKWINKGSLLQLLLHALLILRHLKSRSSQISVVEKDQLREKYNQFLKVGSSKSFLKPSKNPWSSSINDQIGKILIQRANQIKYKTNFLNIFNKSKLKTSLWIVMKVRNLHTTLQLPILCL